MLSVTGMSKLLSGNVLPGDKLVLPDTAILGTNITRQEDGQCYSLVSGSLERQGDHFTILTQKEYYYRPEQCDLVIGRVTSLKIGSWQLDIGALHEATLGIDSINLPGLLRVRDSADEAFQRSWLAENELIAAEVRRTNPASLNARSAVMGKLSHGILVKGRPYHVVGLKSYYNEQGIRLIVGRNGWIWLSGQIKEETGDANSCVDRRDQRYTDEEIIVVGQAWQRLQAAVLQDRPINEDDIFE